MTSAPSKLFTLYSTMTFLTEVTLGEGSGDCNVNGTISPSLVVSGRPARKTFSRIVAICGLDRWHIGRNDVAAIDWFGAAKELRVRVDRKVDAIGGQAGTQAKRQPRGEIGSRICMGKKKYVRISALQNSLHRCEVDFALIGRQPSSSIR